MLTLIYWEKPLKENGSYNKGDKVVFSVVAKNEVNLQIKMDSVCEEVGL